MKKVASINSKKVLGSTIDLLNHHQTPEEKFLFTGAIVSILLPQIICSTFGIIPLIMSVVSTTSGVLIGYFLHRYFPYQDTSEADEEKVSDDMDNQFPLAA